MTLVNIALTSDSADGEGIPAKGVLRFIPTRRRTASGKIVLPIPFTVLLVDGTAVVELEPNTTEWFWRVDEHITGAPSRAIFTSIPDVAEVAYADLVALDPKTFEPAAELTPAWAAVVAGLQSTVTELQASVNAGTLTPDPDDPGFFLIGAA